MNYIAMYLFIGFLSYIPMARALAIDLKSAKWHELLLASTIWATIWLPQMLHTIVVLQLQIIDKRDKEKK